MNGLWGIHIMEPQCVIKVTMCFSIIWESEINLNSWSTEKVWRRKWQPTPVFLSGESPWTEESAGYSPWGPEESDSTEWLSTTQGKWNVEGGLGAGRTLKEGQEPHAAWMNGMGVNPFLQMRLFHFLLNTDEEMYCLHYLSYLIQLQMFQLLQPDRKGWIVALCFVVALFSC